MENSQRAIEPLLTVREVAGILKTSVKAIYAMHERGHIGGAFKIRRRLLFKSSAFLDWIEENAISQKGEINERIN